MVNRLLDIVSDALSSQEDYLTYCRKVRKDCGISSNDPIWIPGIRADAYMLGTLSERSSQMYRSVANICSLLNFDQDALIACVKSMQRWEKHNGRWDRNTSLFLPLSQHDSNSLKRFLTITV